MDIFNAGDLETKEGSILLILFVIGLLYYCTKYSPTWEFGIILPLCFCAPCLCDVIGCLLHDFFVYVYKKLIKK